MAVYAALRAPSEDEAGWQHVSLMVFTAAALYLTLMRVAFV